MNQGQQILPGVQRSKGLGFASTVKTGCIYNLIQGVWWGRAGVRWGIWLMPLLGKGDGEHGSLNEDKARTLLESLMGAQPLAF